MEENKNQEVVEETASETAEAETLAEETLEGNAEADTLNDEAGADNADSADVESEAKAEEAEQPTKEKAKLFKKKKDPKDEKIEELSDKLLRQMAEFDNFRNRTEKEKSAMYEIGAKDIIEKLLPVVDNFERGFTTVAEEDKEDAFVTGMEMVYKQLMTMLEGVGVKPIEAVGQEFNPDLHNAVMHVEDETVGGNIIVEEFQKGYTYRDSVVRYSMVKVAN